MITKQKPLYDRVIVKRLEDAAVSKLIVREVATVKPMRAEVIAVGPGRKPTSGDTLASMEGGNLVPLTVKVGDIVLIGKYSGTAYEETDPVTFKTIEYAIIREDDILTIFEKGKK
jgi:chaperonin GroES